jgi:hypothetical protein
MSRIGCRMSRIGCWRKIFIFCAKFTMYPVSAEEMSTYASKK